MWRALASAAVILAEKNRPYTSQSKVAFLAFLFCGLAFDRNLVFGFTTEGVKNDVVAHIDITCRKKPLNLIYRILRGEVDASVIRSNLGFARCCGESGIEKVIHEALKNVSGEEREEVLDDLVITLAFFATEYQSKGGTENRMSEFFFSLSKL